MNLSVYNRRIRNRQPTLQILALTMLSLHCLPCLLIHLQETFKYKKLLNPHMINYLQGKGRRGSPFNLLIKKQRKLHHPHMGDQRGWPGRQRDHCGGISGIACTGTDRQTALEKRAEGNAQIQLPPDHLRVLTQSLYLVTLSHIQHINSPALMHRGSELCCSDTFLMQFSNNVGKTSCSSLWPSVKPTNYKVKPS